MGPRRRRVGAGFTLIELLVVVAIIAMLIGLLVPGLAGARDAARGAACASNQRQIMLAMTTYADEHGEALPGAGGVTDARSWFLLLGPYLGDQVEAVARCPSDRSPWWDLPHPDTGTLRRVSFGSNFFLSGRLPGYEPYDSLRSISNPSRTIFSSELHEENEYAVSEHFHPELWLIDPIGESSTQLAIHRHAGVCNWGHLDGHVEALALDDVYRLESRSAIGDLHWFTNRLDPRVGH